jgi:hypothetical protein
MAITPRQLQVQAETMAAMRRVSQPIPGDPGARPRECRGCGKVFWRVVEDHRWYCVRCAAGRQVAGGLSGGLGDERAQRKRVRAALAYWHAEARKLGIE